MAVEKQRITVDEYEAFIARPENRDRRFELINGELAEMTPTELHGTITYRIVLRLGVYVEEHNLGRVTIETRYQMPGDDENAVVPDLSFTRRERLQPIVGRGPVHHMPDLAVEVKSPDDRYTDLRAKAAYYLANGAQMVWLVYPEKRLLEIYRKDADLDILTVDDLLDGGDLLPGFSLHVHELFPE